MFDWNDEELANIIWGEAGETDDHTVPYPLGNGDNPPGSSGNNIKREWKEESRNAKPAELNKSVSRNAYLGGTQESALQYDTAEGSSAAGYRTDTWLDSSLSCAAKTDQDAMGTLVPKNLTEITKFDSSRGADKTSQLGDGSDILQNQHEDREQRDYVDYGWDSIGSFDDLDRIFSNDGPVFGHERFGNADQLWSSSKEATSAAEKSFPLSTDRQSFASEALRSKSVHSEVETEYVQGHDQSFPHGFGAISYLSSHVQKNVHGTADEAGLAGGKTKPPAKEKTELEMQGNALAFNSRLAAENFTTHNDFRDKVGNQKQILRTKKKSGGREGQLWQASCSIRSPHGNQFQQFGQIAPLMPHNCITSVLSQQTQVQGPACSQYQQSPNSLTASSVFGSIKKQYSTMTSIPQNHSKEEHQQLLSGYEVSSSTANPLNKFQGTSMSPPRMTPQEKIEKLRRQQQMRALLAIQKQQQQLSHRVSSYGHSVDHTCLHENQVQLMHGGNFVIEENGSSVPSVDPISPSEQDDSNTICMAVADNYSMEDAIVHQLQDVIAKLDIRTRLCIRDSLFRLAQSAMQRNYACDRNITNKKSRDELEVLTKEETSSHNRFPQIPDVEAQTNPIDRTVAHLLFHRPQESFGKHPEGAGLLCSPIGFVPNNHRSKQNLSHHGSKIPHSIAEGDWFKSPHIDTSENASNIEESDAGGLEVESSQ